MITRIDENTGREVRQLTDLPHGAFLPYFRRRRHLPDGRIIAFYYKDKPAAWQYADIVLVDVESGDLEFPKDMPGVYMTIVADGRAIFSTLGKKREIWAMILPDGEPELLGALSEEIPGKLGAPAYQHNCMCDGRTIVLIDTQEPKSNYPPPVIDDVDNPGNFWRYIYRPRSGGVYSYDLAENTLTRCHHLDNYSFQHLDPSPTDPTLVKFAQDGLGVFDQRVWAVRTDGSQLTKIRPQRKGEWVHHEFWWPDGQFICYKYVDRRNDVSIHERPWGELAPRPLQLGIADLTGREVYLSEPLCCFHSHLYVSPKADMISGEGTLDHSFVYAGPFSWSDYNIDLQPLATVHTPYLLGAAQSVECGFTTDSRWLLYNDTVDGKKQVFAVRV